MSCHPGNVLSEHQHKDDRTQGFPGGKPTSWHRVILRGLVLLEYDYRWGLNAALWFRRSLYDDGWIQHLSYLSYCVPPVICSWFTHMRMRSLPRRWAHTLQNLPPTAAHNSPTMTYWPRVAVTGHIKIRLFTSTQMGTMISDILYWKHKDRSCTRKVYKVQYSLKNLGC